IGFSRRWPPAWHFQCTRGGRLNFLWRVHMPGSQGTDLGAALLAPLALLLGGIPKLIAFALILIVGWIVAGFLGGLTSRLLQRIQFERVAERTGLRGFIRQMGTDVTASRLVGDLVKWLVRLCAIVVAFDSLGLPAVSQVVQNFLLWLPNLVVAMAILVLGGLAAMALSRVVRGATSEAGFGNAGLLATVASVEVWAFAIIIAVNQIGVA